MNPPTKQPITAAGSNTNTTIRRNMKTNTDTSEALALSLFAQRLEALTEHIEDAPGFVESFLLETPAPTATADWLKALASKYQATRAPWRKGMFFYELKQRTQQAG